MTRRRKARSGMNFLLTGNVLSAELARISLKKQMKSNDGEQVEESALSYSM
jgi:hypothetical protein